MANTKTCTHIKVTGVRCGSPALYGEQFCYFHQHAHRGVRKPPQSRLHPIAILEDEESIQASLMEVINALMRNTIDLKRAELILRALHIAVKNARRAKFDANANRVVRDIPQYAEPDTAPEVREEEVREVNVGTVASAVQRPLSEAQGSIAGPGEEDELPAVAASTYKPVHPDPEFWERWERGGQVLKQKEADRRATTSQVGTADLAVAPVRVGTDAFVRPATLSEAKGSAPAHDFKQKQRHRSLRSFRKLDTRTSKHRHASRQPAHPKLRRSERLQPTACPELSRRAQAVSSRDKQHQAPKGATNAA